MNFKPELCELVLSGVKTVTRRPINGKTACAYKVGRDYAVCPGRGKRQLGRMVVLSVTTEPVGDIDDADARREGFDDREHFIGCWMKLYSCQWNPDAPVWRIEFELIPAAGGAA